MAYLFNRNGYDYALEEQWKRMADSDMAVKFPSGEVGFAGPDPFNKMAITCNRCGERGLWWRKTSDGWRLFPEGAARMHRCRST
jgi:hypothetical protein